MWHIPCQIVTRNADGKELLVATTFTYRGAKRLRKKLLEFNSNRVFKIYEIWNSPLWRWND